MAIFDGIKYANSDAYIKSNLLYMNLFTGKSESHVHEDDCISFLANMTIFLEECKSLVESLKTSLGQDNRRLEPLSEKMLKYFTIDDKYHSFIKMSDSDSTVHYALKRYDDSLNEGDVLFSKEVENVIEHANFTLEKDVIPTMKDKLTCIKNCCIPSKNFNEDDKYGIIRNDLKKDKLISAIKESRKSLLFLRDELKVRISDTENFINKVIKKYNNLSNDELKKFKLSAILLNITLGMQIKMLTTALDKYYNYSMLYDTRFDILKGECD